MTYAIGDKLRHRRVARLEGILVEGKPMFPGRIVVQVTRGTDLLKPGQILRNEDAESWDPMVLPVLPKKVDGKFEYRVGQNVKYVGNGDYGLLTGVVHSFFSSGKMMKIVVTHCSSNRFYVGDCLNEPTNGDYGQNWEPRAAPEDLENLAHIAWQIGAMAILQPHIIRTPEYVLCFACVEYLEHGKTKNLHQPHCAAAREAGIVRLKV